MATAVNKCRVCGKSYEACRTMNKTAGVFRWQEVACSPECGAEYLHRVTEARSPAPSAAKSGKVRRRTAPVAEVAEPNGMPMAEPDIPVPAGTYAEMPVENE